MSMFNYLFRRITRIILDFVAFVIGLRFPNKTAYLPPITESILLEPASQLAKKIKCGKIKSEDVVRTYITRCLAVQPHINAIVKDSFDAAIKEAKEVDRCVRYELDGNRPLKGVSIHSQPLLGIPFTAKDSFAIRNMPWTSGLYTRKGITSSVDSEVIALMRSAGAIFLAMTNVPELIMWWHSTNVLYGRTNNPYDNSRIPGGSSGGECALLASAGSLLGIGSDIGGSIREPSFFCGVFGHKTTSGVVSTDGIYPDFGQKRKQLLSVGPFCRYACDLKPMLNVLAGPRAGLLKLDEEVDLSKIKVYYMEGHNNPSISPLHPEIRTALNTAVKHLGLKCREVEKVYFKGLELGFDLWMTAMTDPTAPSLEEELANRDGLINPYIELFKCFAGLSKFSSASIISCFDHLITGLSNPEYAQHLRALIVELKEQLYPLLADNAVLIYPGHPTSAPKHNQTILKVKNISYTCVFNPLNVAITSVPLGLSSMGLPIGVQVIVGPMNDRFSIAVAEELEKACKGWVPPCNVLV